MTFILEREFSIGDDVYVRNPERFIVKARCIVGPIKVINEGLCTVSASVGRMPDDGGCFDAEIEVPLSEIAHRIGTPISRVSGRPGHEGYTEFCRIAASWGYD